MSIEERIRKLGIVLPEAPAPAANYRPYTRAAGLVFVSGQLPVEGGELRYRGMVGEDLSIEDGYAAARLCAINVLAQLRAALGSLDELELLVRVDGHVCCPPHWTQQPKVINGASDLFAEVLGDRAGHARVALGHSALPLGAAVEVAATALARG